MVIHFDFQGTNILSVIFYLYQRKFIRNSNISLDKKNKNTLNRNYIDYLLCFIFIKGNIRRGNISLDKKNILNRNYIDKRQTIPQLLGDGLKAFDVR